MSCNSNTLIARKPPFLVQCSLYLELMFCSGCGSLVDQNANFCKDCGKAIHSSTEKQGTSSEDSNFTSTKVKSFASFRKSKGKEWKSRVTKSSNSKEEKKKNEDVVVHLGLMEWNEKDQILKSKRGKRLPLRVSSNASYVTLRQQAEEKWKTFHSNLYNESQAFHLLLEDGKKALFLPGSKKEPFTLNRYQEELGKDYKRITLFLCPDHDFQISEGNFDEDDDLTDFGDDDSDAPVSCNKRQKCEIDLSCDTDDKTSTQCDRVYQDQQMEMTQKLKCEDQLDQDQKHKCDQSTHDLDMEHIQQLQQLEEDQNLAFDLQRCYDAEDNITREDENKTISDSSSVVTYLGRQVDESSTFFIVTRRGAPLDRTLSIWSREVKKNTGNTKKVVRVHFSGEQGIDSGAMAKEFFTITLPNIGSVIFPNGQPVDSTFHVHNGNFKACGEIVAASIAQGGPAPCFLEESVYGLMADPNLPLQQLECEKHLTTSDGELLKAIKEDIMAHTDTIIEHGYTGIVDALHLDDILSSVAISLVSKRLVYLKEFLNGLDSYGLKDIIQTYPEACKPLFVKYAGNNDAVDANYLFSALCPEHAEEGSSRRKVEESTMDLLQDFLFRLEDDPNVNCSGYAEAMASCEDTGKETPAGSKEELLLPDLTPAGVLGWLTGQKHKPISGEQMSITVKFDHDCLIRNPKHQICFPMVRACAKEITLPIAHMKTQEAFNEVLMLALSKGQSFSMA